MSTHPISIDELKAKSKQADALIQKLQKQIEQVKKASTPEYMAEQTKRLQAENEQLKKKVESLKKELEEAEAKNGGASMWLPWLLKFWVSTDHLTLFAKSEPLGSITNKQEAKDKKPAAEKKAAAPAKSESSKPCSFFSET